MLASITPLGERGRHSTWWVTVSAFLLGASVAGAVAGAALGALGWLALPDVASPHVRLVALAVALAAAVAVDAGARRVPGPRRQVDERWLDEYRGWVYGIGYGAQLGLGVTTVVSSAATYVALLAAVLVASPGGSAIVVGCFGAVRGLTLFAAAGVRSPPRLVGFHRAMAQWRTRARWAGVATEAGALLLALSLAT